MKWTRDPLHWIHSPPLHDNVRDDYMEELIMKPYQFRHAQIVGTLRERESDSKPEKAPDGTFPLLIASMKAEKTHFDLSKQRTYNTPKTA